ncbi:hypothetical protein [Capnocytophaga sp.]|uniref:hypothetical protein n=1 Tax=Capnocytophaga sp. TaxID=44737 RepID=UPI0026DA852C|nr:hypothetical protein [Capnocytophaga sp.]MDO5105458.1 hypothetical protein [Capnocytophaga sp.]
MKRKLLIIIFLITLIGWGCVYYFKYKENKKQIEEVQKVALLEKIVLTDNYRKTNGLPLINQDFITEDSTVIYGKCIDDFIEIYYDKKNGDEKNIYKISDSIYLTIKYIHTQNARALGIFLSQEKKHKYISFVDFHNSLKKHNKLCLSNDTLFYNEKIKDGKLNDTIVSRFEKEELKKLNRFVFSNQ